MDFFFHELIERSLWVIENSTPTKIQSDVYLQNTHEIITNWKFDNGK